MVIKDKTYFITGRVFPVQYFQKTDEIGAFVGRPYKRNCFAGKQVNSGKQGQRTQPNIYKRAVL